MINLQGQQQQQKHHTSSFIQDRKIFCSFDKFIYEKHIGSGDKDTIKNIFGK